MTKPFSRAGLGYRTHFITVMCCNHRITLRYLTDEKVCVDCGRIWQMDQLPHFKPQTRPTSNNHIPDPAPDPWTWTVYKSSVESKYE